jgi:hypothetical protein
MDYASQYSITRTKFKWLGPEEIWNRSFLPSTINFVASTRMHTRCSHSFKVSFMKNCWSSSICIPFRNAHFWRRITLPIMLSSRVARISHIACTSSK